MRTTFRAAAFFVFVSLGLAGPVSAATSSETVAQAATVQSSISGKITDSRGTPLADSQITIEGGGKTYTAKTKGDGSFSVAVPPGVYTVTVNHGGFQTAQNDVSVAPGSGNTVISVALQEVNLSSLSVIGRTSTSSTRTPFNVSESAISVLPPLEIQLRQNVNLTDTVATLPGVLATRAFSVTPNTSFAVHGLTLQTRVTIDGHPVSSGIFGAWNTNYAASGIFQDVEVAKGTGLNGAIAGESAVGTVNLRTRNFTRDNSAGLQIGTDSYNGGLYNIFADVNFLKDKKASLIVAKSFSALNGPWNNTFLDRAGNTNASAFRGTLQAPSIVGLDQWQGDFSNRYSLEGELVKLRYRFSETTSVTAEYLGLQGQYQPQGGSYGTFLGNMTQQACSNGSGGGLTFSPTSAGCSLTSTYNAPYTAANAGNTVPAYSWFPNSFIQNNEPQFAVEFRTSWKNDTILFRPYTHLINRFISGAFENLYPGNGGGWSVVTNAANCQVLFVGPTAGGGAKGPCFGLNMTPTGPAYVGADATPHGYATTNVAPACSPTPPYTCFTTPTGIQNDGVVNFGTPFSQPEIDRLNGYTFTWIHPVGNNTYSFSYDYRKDFAQSYSGDQTGAPANCQYTIGSASGANAVIANTVPGTSFVKGNPYQPTCSDYTRFVGVPGASPFLPRSSLNTPPTVSQYGDFSLTGTFQVNERLSVALGNYLSMWKANAQIEDPAILALYAAAGNANAAPVSLVTRSNWATHYDPHIGLEYRAGRDTSIRANAGSSFTQPYPSLISGFGAITIPNAANGGNYTNTIPNFGIKPETTVAYDIGLDQRLHDGGVLSLDLYNDTVHNVWVSSTANLAPIPGVCGPNQNPGFPNALCLQTNQVNGSLERTYGVDLSLYKAPVNGWGYFLAGTLNRTYYDQLPLSIYTSNTSPGGGSFLINGMQLFGNPFFKSYGQLLWADARGNVFELGADYEGANNATYGPAFTIWDASARIRIHPKMRLQISAQNLMNLNTGSLLGRALGSQGNLQPTVYVVPGTTTVLQGNSSTASLFAVPPRTIRISLEINP